MANESDRTGAQTPEIPDPIPDKLREELERDEALEAGSQDVSGAGDPALPYYVVGLGASAGGLEALERFFSNLPTDTGMAFVVVQHLSPDHKSLMAELLSRYTRMSVTRAGDGDPVEPNHVYLIPPGKNIVLARGHIRLVEKIPHASINLPIDIFFRSLAEQQTDRCAGIVLSGTGSDGMHGIGAIKEAGGLVMVQDTDSAKFDGMPRSAVSTGLADFVLPPEEMPEKLVRYVRERVSGNEAESRTTLRAGDRAYIELMGLLKRESGVDFTHYKPSTVLRRIERRMEVNHTPRLEDYTAFVRENPEETTTLFKELLIGVTRFFRDPEVFERLREQIVAPLVRRTPSTQTLRIWVAGCSTGEEAYSLSILFLEEIKAAEKSLEFKIFATDIDREALEFAGTASYPESSMTDVSPERRAAYFERRGDRYVVTHQARQPILFTRHNVFKDPPFTRLDLISCRNLLIYLEPSLQRRVFSLFHFALKPGGTLLLGTSETIGDMIGHFRPLDNRSKLYEAIGVPRIPVSDSLQLEMPEIRPRFSLPSSHGRSDESRIADRITASLLEEFAPAALLIDEYYQLIHVFGDASVYLRIQPGSASLNLLKMAIKPLSAVLACAVPRALRQSRENAYVGIEIPGPNGCTSVNVRVRPIVEAGQHVRYLLILLERAERIERRDRSPEEVSASQQSEQQIAELQLELQHSKESLQAMIEELETSNEELQATNEELLASNEELQSTNEELQSVNEELHSVNAEYEQKIAELVDLNNDIDNLLRSTDLGTLFLDEHLHVRKFTPAVTEYISLLDRDIGRPIEHLAFHLGGEGFIADVRRVLTTGHAIERPEFRSGKRYVLIRITPYIAYSAVRPSGAVVTFVDVSSVVRVTAQMKWVLDSLPEHVAVLDPTGTIQVVNASWERFARENGCCCLRAVDIGANYLEQCMQATGESAEIGRAIAGGILKVIHGELPKFHLEYRCHSSDGASWFIMTVSPLDNGGGVVISHLDITKRKLEKTETPEAAD